MKPSEIAVGKLYTNGKTRETLRRVLKINEIPTPDLPYPAVYFKNIAGWCRRGIEMWVSLQSFAKWAAAEVKEGG